MTQDEFDYYNARNPHVYEAFKKFTFQVIKTGRKYFSARAIWHRIRWHTTIEDNQPMFKINDHHSPMYARQFEKDFPIYKGFFRKRKCEADRN